MRIDLILQPGQFGLGVLMALFFELLLELPDSDEVADANGNGNHNHVEQKEHEGAREETHPGASFHLRHMLANHEIAVDESVVDASDKQDVDERKRPELAAEEKPRAEEVEVNEIDHHRRPQLLPNHQ